jgi:hypothetical protein
MMGGWGGEGRLGGNLYPPLGDLPPHIMAAPAITIAVTMAPATRPSRGVSLQGLRREILGLACPCGPGAAMAAAPPQEPAANSGDGHLRCGPKH